VAQGALVGERLTIEGTPVPALMLIAADLAQKLRARNEAA
jgi:hypothetical protein